jgi:hypothetical protein
MDRDWFEGWNDNYVAIGIVVAIGIGAVAIWVLHG